MTKELEKALKIGDIPSNLLSTLSDNERVKFTVEFAVRWGGHDGGHHKAWAIDQMVRILTGDQYETVVKEACDGEDGPNTYDWDVGIPP